MSRRVSPRLNRRTRRRTDQPARRRGFTLVELMMVLVIGACVAAAVGQVLRRQQRFYANAATLVGQRVHLRDATGILPGELRALAPGAGDVLAFSDSSLDIRATIGTAIACDTLPGGTGIDLAPPRVASGTVLAAFTTAPSGSRRNRASRTTAHPRMQAAVRPQKTVWKLLSCLPEMAPMHKFDEMFTQAPGLEPFQFQSQSMGDMSQTQVQGVRDHYRTYAQWLGRQPQEIIDLDIARELEPFDLKRELSSNRTQGVPNMIALVREHAQRIAERPVAN